MAHKHILSSCGHFIAAVSTTSATTTTVTSIVCHVFQELETAFHVDSTAGAAVLALYYFPLGISSLAWGPACDLWGRKSTYLASTVMYAAATFGCIFAQNMQMMLAFRALQGMARE